jgi:glutamine kinase
VGVTPGSVRSNIIFMATSTVIILGAGPPHHGQSPSALTRTRGRRVLDWIMDAFKGAMDPEFHFVGGYRLHEVVEEYPDIHFSVNPHWTTSGSLGSLLVAPLERGRDTYISYADTVFRSNAVKGLRDAAGFATVVVDSSWKTRYPSRSAADLRGAEKVCLSQGMVTGIGRDVPDDGADAEYVGLAKLSPPATDAVIALRDRARPERRNSGIPDLLGSFVEAGLDVPAIDIKGDWAELNAPQDLARFVLGTKAETLERLRPLVRASRIGEVFRFTVGQWCRHREEILTSIRKGFGNGSVVVRSSAIAEDSWASSGAGAPPAAS